VAKILGAIVTGKRTQLAVTIRVGATILKVEIKKQCCKQSEQNFFTCSEIHLRTCTFLGRLIHRCGHVGNPKVTLSYLICGHFCITVSVAISDGHSQFPNVVPETWTG